MVEIKNLCFSYGEQKILDNLSLKINDGQCVCLKGRSGCGKTTVLRLLLGLETPLSGEISGVENPTAVFQEDRLVPNLTLKKNVLLPLKPEQHARALELIEKANLSDAQNKRVALLSGGMKRRTAIVRALSFGGDFLILDEPFNGIDRENRTKIAEIIKEEFLKKGKPVLMVSHIDEDAEILNAKTVIMDN